MKNLIVTIFCTFLLIGCGEKTMPNTDELTPADVAQMTEEQKKAEIAKTFASIGVELPDNWDEMNKKERGQFILKYGLGVE